MRLLISVRSRVNCSWNVAMDSRLSSALTRGSLLQSPKRERVGVCESRAAARNKASFGLTLRAFGRMQIVATNTRSRRAGIGARIAVPIHLFVRRFRRLLLFWFRLAVGRLDRDEVTPEIVTVGGRNLLEIQIGLGLADHLGEHLAVFLAALGALVV